MGGRGGGPREDDEWERQRRGGILWRGRRGEEVVGGTSDEDVVANGDDPVGPASKNFAATGHCRRSGGWLRGLVCVKANDVDLDSVCGDLVRVWWTLRTMRMES